jgi:uncharacterized protein (TIGR01777 family)
MNIIITGGTGLIGRAFRVEMEKAGHQIWVLSRSGGGNTIQWDGKSARGWEKWAEQANAIVNLAGTNIGAGLWTKERKRSILESRLDAGQAVVEAVRGAANRPLVVLQASAVGYYGVTGDRVVDESSSSGVDWQSDVVRQWEASTSAVEELGVRRVTMRTGVVLTRGEGILTRFQLPFNLFLGGPLGSGTQYVSWIHVRDQVRAMRFLLETPQMSGAFNLTSPQPVMNAEFGKTLGQVMKRPYWFPTPGFALKLVLGEMSTLVLDGQRVIPRRLQEAGFLFEYSDLHSALENILTVH